MLHVSKICRLLAVVLIGSAVFAHAASPTPPVQFVGHATTKTETFFVIRDVKSGEVSGWMSIGQSFRGYTLERYDSASDTLTVRGANGRIALKIEEGRVREAEPSSAAEPASSAKTVTVVGGVVHPARIEAGMVATLADALAASGGLKEGAMANRVRVTRRAPDGRLMIYSIDASPGASGASSPAAFVLRPGDIVFVPVRDNAEAKR